MIRSQPAGCVMSSDSSVGSASKTNSSTSKTSPSLNQPSAKRGPERLASYLIRKMYEPIQLVASSWNQFWYTPSDPVVLCVMRLFVGAMLVYTHLVWGLNLPAFLGTSGWNSPEVLAAVQEVGFAPSFWWYVPEQYFLSVHCVCIGILVLFWIGFATRVTSVLSMIITISYSYRAHMSNFGLDQINAILCLYLCIGPSGALLSVDRWLAVWKARRRALANHQKFVTPPVIPSVSANLAIRLTQIHFCVIYTYAGLSKLQGGAWWNGEAVWLAFANLEYQSVDMTWIAWYPWVSDLMTHTTIIWEVFFAALIWVRPLRPLMLLMGFALHAGIGGMMGMWTFGLIMIFGHLSFWPVETVRSLLARLTWLRMLAGTAPFTNTSLTTRRDQRVGSSLQPALLWIDSTVRGRLQGLSYFLKRGFRCLATDDMREAQAVCDATSPDAVVLMGTDRQDDEVAGFHATHFSNPNASPLFLVLSEDQSNRLNGRIHTPGSHVLTGTVSLSVLRREIQDRLSQSEPPELRTASPSSGLVAKETIGTV